MKKPLFFLLMLLMSTIGWQATAQCGYSVKLIDSYGDGWNGNTMDVLVNGTVVLEGITLSDPPGDVQIIPFTVNNGDEITAMYYATGLYGSENSFEILDVNNTVVGSGNSTTNITTPIIVFCPSCPSPIGLAIDALSETTADVSWTAGNTETEWNISWGTPGFIEGGAGEIGAVNAHPTAAYTIAGLTANTQYEFRVQADCGSEESDWTGISFGTACELVSSFPFTETFEDDSQSFACWSQEYVTGMQDWTVDNGGGNGVSSAHNGTSNALFRVGADNGNTTKLLSPAFDFSSQDQMNLTFWYSNEEWYGSQSELRVYYKTSSSGAWTLIPGAEYTSSVNAWTKEELILPSSASAGEYYIAFEGVNQWSYGITLDDITIDAAPSCPDPTALVVDAITGTTADVSWTAGNTETEWNISWGTPGFIVGGAGELGADIVNTTAAFQITSLSANTQYEFRVQADCGSEESAWVGSDSFWTTQIAATLPYNDDFSTNQFTFVNGTQTNKWAYGAAVGNPDNSIYISNDDGVNNTYMTSSTSTVQAYRDIAIPADATTAEFSFDWRAMGEGFTSTKWDSFRVWLVPANYSPTAGTQITAGSGRIQVGDGFNNSATWQTFSDNQFDVSTFAGQTMRLVFQWRNDSSGGTQPPAAIDNIRLEIPSCPAPTVLTVDATTTTTADVSWTAGNTETDWDIYWGTPGFTVGGAGQIGTDVANTTTAYTITGLSANTEYEFIVQADCGVDGQSILSDPASFRTACDPFGDFVENFDTTTTGQVPSCWSTLKENSVSEFAVVNVSTSFPVSAPNSIRFTNSNDATASLYLITPELTALSEGDHQLRFSYRGNNFSTLEVGTMSDPTNASSFTLVEALTTTTSHAEYLVLFNQSYADAVIAFKVTFSSTYNSSYLDDVIWEPIPSCPDPTALAVGAITATTADVSWTAGASETDWNISWGTPGFIVGGAGQIGSDIVNTTAAFQISGLDANTQYEVRVQADCGEGGESAWVGSDSFWTSQIAATLPYTDDFSTNQFTFVNGMQTNKWAYGAAAGNPGNSIYISNDIGVSNAYTISSTSTVQAFRDIAVPADATTAEFSFDWKAVGESIGTSKYDYFRVWLVPASYSPTAGSQITAGAGRIQVGDRFNNSATWQTFSDNQFDVSTFAGQTMRLVFEWRNDSGGGTQPPAAIDNIHLEIPSCPAPSALTVDAITGTTADVSWIAGNTETDWNISWGTPGFIVGGAGELGTDIVNTTAAYQITGLDGNTQYEVRVQADCGEGDESAWVGITIQTPCAPGAIPFMEGFESGYADQAAVAGCWSQESLNGSQNWTANNSLTNYGRGPRTGSFSAYLRYSNEDWLFYPLVLEGGTAYELKFFARQDATSGTSVQAAWGTADNSAAMTNTIIASSPVTNGEYQEFSGTFIPPSNGVYYIGIKATLSASPWYINLDDISVDVASGYYYVNGAWSPSDPSVDAGPTDDIFVVDGVTSFTTDMVVNDITVMSGATLNIEGVLTSNGNITNDGDLVFVSSDTRNGELAAVAGTITGDVTVERYMKNRRSYRMVSSAVTTTSSIHDNWQEGATGSTDNPNPGFGTHITGSTTDQEFGFDGTITGNPSMFFVDGAAQAFTAVANTDVNTLTAGFPYLLFVRGDRNIDLTDPTNNLSSSTVLRATGSLVTGTQTQNFPTVEAGNVVMFGNPYQSAVDMDVVRVNSTNLNTNHYYVYDPNIATYGGYTTVSFIGAPNTPPSAANQYLQPGQGAQMATLAAGPSAVIFNESDKAPGQFTDTNRNPMSINDMLTVQLYTTENFNNGGSVHDSFGIIFAEGNNNGLTSVDAVKPMNFYENLGVNHNGTYLSLEYREMPQPAEVYPLYSTGYAYSDYTLKLTIDGLEASFFYLDDHFTGTTTLLDAGDTTYGFTVDANNPMSIATDRFSIRTEQRLGIDDNSLLAGIRLFPNPLNGDTFYINAPKLNGEQLSVSISDLTGRSIYKQTLDCRANTVTVPMGDNMSSGVYLVTLKHGGEAHTYRLIKE